MKPWHLRLPHIHTDGIRTMFWNGVVRGVNATLKKQYTVRACCMYEESMRATILWQRGPHSNSTLDLVNTWYYRPFPADFLGGPNYFLSLIDDHSCSCCVYSLKGKHKLYEAFQKLFARIETQNSDSVNVLKLGNGGEHIFTIMQRLLKNVKLCVPLHLLEIFFRRVWWSKGIGCFLCLYEQCCGTKSFSYLFGLKLSVRQRKFVVELRLLDFRPWQRRMKQCLKTYQISRTIKSLDADAGTQTKTTSKIDLFPELPTRLRYATPKNFVVISCETPLKKSSRFM